MTHPLKDFIYLDNERIRSYTAQINGHLIEQTQKSAAHSVMAEGKGGTSGLAKAFFEAELGASYAFEKSSTETATLHHAAFELLVSGLEKNGLFDSKDKQSYDKPFSEITCHLRLVDYSVLVRQLRNMSTLMPLFQKVMSSEAKASDKQQYSHMKDLSEAIELLYGEAKILQLISVFDGSVIAQVVLDDILSIPVRNLFEANSNNILPGEWNVFCIHETEPPELEPPVPDNDIAKSLVELTDAIKALKTVISSVIDAPNVVPIAIYRILQ